MFFFRSGQYLQFLDDFVLVIVIDVDRLAFLGFWMQLGNVDITMLFEGGLFERNFVGALFFSLFGLRWDHLNVGLLFELLAFNGFKSAVRSVHEKMSFRNNILK